MTQTAQIIFALFFFFILMYSFPTLSSYMFRSEFAELEQVEVPKKEKTKFEKWLEHFNTEVLAAEACGKEAIANPWDGLEEPPSSQELIILQRMLKSKGFDSHIINNHITIILS